MTFSPLDSALLGPLFATDEMRTVFSERRFLAGMLRVEVALARAQAAEGLVSSELADAIEVVGTAGLDPEAMAATTRMTGVPAISFVRAVQSALPPSLAGGFHFGATSQDIVDTAHALQLAEALDIIEVDLHATVSAMMNLAAAHCNTPCIGRTALQHAAPVTFGYKASGWCVALAEHLVQLPALRKRVLVASLGGPVGTLAAMEERADAVLEGFAADLGLAIPALAWHTQRARIVEVASWLAILLGILAKMATDVVHLSSTEVRELSEPVAPGRGGSSAMPHKRNPISSITILSQHAAAGAQLSILVNGMASLHERPVGAWHSEWLALPTLFGLAGGAVREGRFLAEGLLVDADQMGRNLQLTNGLIFSDAVAGQLAKHLGRAEAYAAVEDAAAEVLRSGGSFQGQLNQRLPDHRDAIAIAFDTTPAIQAGAARCRSALDHVARILGPASTIGFQGG
ncbi:class-II fumarase/aspartase family protein [Novosphingobium resinovorum]|uniref:3-sulfo-cis,cis-muconate cycloisomerase n=1 Tax=Novosphingobium resinovorum TaxID=158500 RepID=Q2TPW0_9SPHN|nr:adenylosuccinate lyase family protein [Novosphingobium resinovorum]AAW29741.1 3-sulfo-cis,cis-muconate cycloisomerase [Novosphingobium resinovorum]AOR81200.1 3-sulfo-cis,cis-muconate cycloisomerase [Novosphingobium resinovorum]